MKLAKDAKSSSPGDDNSRPNEIFALTGLRFLAAFWVFLFHLQIRWPFKKPGALANFLDEGAIGMSIFFILSGYVLTYIYGRGLFDIRTYYLNRVGRIYPIYLMAALLTVPWLWPLVSHVSTLPEIVRALLKLSILVSTNITLTQAWFPQLFDYWNDGGSWSISAEAFFYLLFPVLIVLLGKLSRKWLFVALIVFYMFSTFPALSFAVFENRPSPGVPIFYAMPIFRLPEFLCGICICLVQTKFEFEIRFPLVVFCLSLIIFIAFVCMMNPHLPIYTGYDFIAVPVVSVAIMILAQGLPFFGSLLGSTVFRWLGHISYCFYSFQALVLLSMISYHDEVVRIVPALSDNGYFAILGFVALLALAAFGYHMIEEPMRKRIRSLRNRAVSPTVKEAERIATGP